MTKFSRSVWIEATPQSVWSVIADFRGVDRWSPGVVRAEVLSPVATGVGAERRREFKGWGAAIERVTAWEEQRGYDVDFRGPEGISARGAMRLRAGDGGTWVTLEADVGRSGRSTRRAMTPIVCVRLRRSMAAELVGLKAFVESGLALRAPVRAELLAGVS